MDGLNHGFSVCTINGAILKNHVRNWNVTTTSGKSTRILICCIAGGQAGPVRSLISP